MITAEQAELFRQLRADGATTTEAAQVIELTTEMSWPRYRITDLAAQLIEDLHAGRSVLQMATQQRLANSMSEMTGMSPQRIIELAVGAAAWTHEARDPHGEWTRSSGSAVIRSGSDLMDAAQREDEIRQVAHEEAVKTATLQDIAYRQQHETAEQARNRKQDAQIRALTKQVRQANLRISQLSEQEEKKKADTKVLAVIASLIGGAILGAVEAFIGVPGLAAIFSSISPAVVETLFEWKKRL